MTAHIGTAVGHCPVCIAAVGGPMPAGGLQLAAITLVHESNDPVDHDLAALATYAVEFHGPGPGNKCRGCGERWGGYEWDGWPSGLPCDEWLQIRTQVNARIIERVVAIVRRNNA